MFVKFVELQINFNPEHFLTIALAISELPGSISAGSFVLDDTLQSYPSTDYSITIERVFRINFVMIILPLL